MALNTILKRRWLFLQDLQSNSKVLILTLIMYDLLIKKMFV